MGTFLYNIFEQETIYRNSISFDIYINLHIKIDDYYVFEMLDFKRFSSASEF